MSSGSSLMAIEGRLKEVARRYHSQAGGEQARPNPAVPGADGDRRKEKQEGVGQNNRPQQLREQQRE